jgi:hypothetical protein
MKIAVPTDDGIRISASSKDPKGYLVFTLQGGEISHEELRWNKPADAMNTELKAQDILGDCSVMIAGTAYPGNPGYKPSEKIEVVLTHEAIITNVIMEYLDVTLLRESNTCCSP